MYSIEILLREIFFVNGKSKRGWMKKIVIDSVFIRVIVFIKLFALHIKLQYKLNRPMAFAMESGHKKAVDSLPMGQ